MTYEGYGPGGIAILVETVTDNRNRTVADVRNVFARGGGTLAENGAVAWQFELRGVITAAPGDADLDQCSSLRSKRARWTSRSKTARWG